MSEYEAKQLVDVVIEGLLEMGVLPEDRYGRMKESQREELALRVKKASEE